MVSLNRKNESHPIHRASNREDLPILIRYHPTVPCLCRPSHNTLLQTKRIAGSSFPRRPTAPLRALLQLGGVPTQAEWVVSRRRTRSTGFRSVLDAVAVVADAVAPAACAVCDAMRVSVTVVDEGWWEGRGR